MKDYQKDLVDMESKLNAISPSMCLAKWLQSTVYLMNGLTHSCHHPSRHVIDPASLIDNPSGLHNTPIKLKARQDMLDGIQTPECEYCWAIENSNSVNQSDRIHKSASNWAEPHFNSVIESGTGENISPKYLEVAFETTCNFACMYCSEDVSSKWMEDINRWGHYGKNIPAVLQESNIKNKVISIKREIDNPYVDAFWKWFPQLYNDLEVFRVTGGEPLLSKDTWKIFDYIRNNPNTSLEFAINTNLNVPHRLIDRLILEAKSVEGNLGKLKIFTSLEATGPHAEYIRDGLVYDEFMSNVNRVLTELPETRMVITTTVNALCIWTFTDFLKSVIHLRSQYTQNEFHEPVGISVNFLRKPDFMDIRIMPYDLKKQKMDQMMEYVYANSKGNPLNGIFYPNEINQLERLCAYTLQEIPNRAQQVKDFNCFYSEYDIRRNLNFNKTFNGFNLV